MKFLFKGVLCPQGACLRGTTATAHLDALDGAAGVQEDQDWAPGEEALPPGVRGEESEGGSLTRVRSSHHPPFQLVCEQTRNLLDQDCCQDGGAVCPSTSPAPFNGRDILFHSEHFVCSVLLFVKDFYVFVFSLR